MTPPAWLVDASNNGGCDLDQVVSTKFWPPHAHEADYNWQSPSNVVYSANDSNANDNTNVNAAKLVEGFAPAFQEARRKLDYSYHKNPARLRQLLQDAILLKVVNSPSASATATTAPTRQPPQQQQRRPWIVFTAGPMGVGKSHVLTQLHKSGLFPLQSYIKIDPDMIKNELPELAGYLQHDADQAATYLHRESTQMADVLFEYALSQAASVLVDGTLRDVNWYRHRLERIRREQPHYRIAILQVTAPDEIVLQRARARAQQTGRSVPMNVLKNSIAQVPESVQALTPQTDLVHVIRNDPDQPLQLVESRRHGGKIQLVGKDTSWLDFVKSWNDEQDVVDDKDIDDQVTRLQQPDAGHDDEQYDTARSIWQHAYPNYCPRCALASDVQCGVCVHGQHLCACAQCRPVGATGYACGTAAAAGEVK